MNRGVTILVIGLVTALAVFGSYKLAEKFLQDRESAMAYQERPVSLPPTQSRPAGRQVKTFTAEELEEARKKGQYPAGSQPFIPPGINPGHDAAVQRTMQTLQEINRINEMNQKLQEQQRRMQEKR